MMGADARSFAGLDNVYKMVTAPLEVRWPASHVCTWACARAGWAARRRGLR